MHVDISVFSATFIEEPVLSSLSLAIWLKKTVG
jgi:hypothetical protein